MSRSKWLWLVWIMAGGLGLAPAWAEEPVSQHAEPSEPYGLGRQANESEIQAWDIDIAPNGSGLPPGKGSVQLGARVYATKCASCHGSTGTEGPMPRLVGGRGSLASTQPIKTVGSFWPYATTLYDYIFRTMPLTAPQSLRPNKVYSLVAWILYRNKIIEESVILDAKTLPTIHMPNRNGFIPDPRPEVP